MKIDQAYRGNWENYWGEGTIKAGQPNCIYNVGIFQRKLNLGSLEDLVGFLLVVFQPTQSKEPSPQSGWELSDCEDNIQSNGYKAVDKHKEEDLIRLISFDIEVVDLLSQYSSKGVENA